MVATKSVEQNNKVTVTSDSSLYYSSLAKKYADEAKIAESNITELLEDAVNTAVTSANTATEKANMAGAEVEKAKAEVEKVTETVQNSLTNIESKTLEGINKIKQTGFYMEGDKLYYIDSNGETKEFKSTGSSAKIGDIGFAPYVDETTNERRRLNGQVLIKDQYPAFVTWLTNLQATTPSLFATEDEWQSIKTASKLGQCGKFVIGDTTIRLPQVININGLVDMSIAGRIKDESLPDPNSKLYSIWGGGSGTGGNQSIIAQNVSGSPQSTPTTGPTYIKVDNPTYQDNAPVQQEAIQYPYYITVNTGSETIEPTIIDYTVTTAYQYGISQYYKGIMNSGAWLRCNGQMNPKTTYEGLYNWALAQLNAEVEGFKSSTASDITDYDFVINQTDETFRLPLKNGMEGVFASGTVPAGYNLYYYCGNVEENLQKVNVARIEESLVDKVDATNTQWAINACMPDYSAGVSKNANKIYTASYDCFVLVHQKTTNLGSGCSIELYDTNNNLILVQGNTSQASSSSANSVSLFIPKNYKYKVVFAGGIISISEYPLKGVK